MGVSVFDDSDQNSTLKPIIDFFFVYARLSQFLSVDMGITI